MHRKLPISQLVYAQLFPNPSPSDPATFSAHLSKNLVGEVRVETATFYGSLDTTEARYPGLNYAYGPHRKRLGRFPHHARLFEAFDTLGLTESEILGFCRWEGTLWARERYERDEGVKVQDTTGNEIGPWVDNRSKARIGVLQAPTPTHLQQLQQRNNNGIEVLTEIEVLVQNRLAGRRSTPAVTDEDIAFEAAQIAARQRMESAAAASQAAQQDEEDMGMEMEMEMHPGQQQNSEWEQTSKDEQERATTTSAAAASSQLSPFRSLGTASS